MLETKNRCVPIVRRPAFGESADVNNANGNKKMSAKGASAVKSRRAWVRSLLYNVSDAELTTLGECVINRGA
jgi:hypothetical protein